MIDHRTRTRLDRSDRERDAARIRGICAEGELAMVFQPIFELDGGACLAFEALTRFPGEPGVPSGLWFARAAEVGVGVELELAAVRTALTHLDDLPEGVLLSLNVSPAAAVAPGFEALIEPAAERVIIELTEHERVEEYAPLEAVLTRLRERGATVAVDDVGAGFASLRHILSLAPDIVKLDLSLTREIETDPGCRALTSALVEFTDGIGAAIAAEGIETEGELALLRDLGVDQGQGYLLGYPLALEGQLQ
ncbi:MAG TPA: EAL domain-containing protein [Gaiellaceae bacterium]|jgi:EAL domain-containing protein (putative c-di-GMP-specific phosphodiesterase class I)